jgi:hypothetical protein
MMPLAIGSAAESAAHNLQEYIAVKKQPRADKPAKLTPAERLWKTLDGMTAEEIQAAADWIRAGLPPAVPPPAVPPPAAA